MSPETPCECARLQTAGAPLRTVTVRDTIGDLPPVENGEDREEMPYGGELADFLPRILLRIQHALVKLQKHSCLARDTLTLTCFPGLFPDDVASQAPL